VAITNGVKESDKCWRSHALWALAVLILLGALFVSAGGYFFVQNQARAQENTDQNIQIVVVQTQLEHIRMSLARIEARQQAELAKKP
jgi:uncharacterized protein HemX